MLPNIGPWELILILVIAFLVFGPKRLPDLARSLGESIREFKKSMTHSGEQPTAIAQAEEQKTPIEKG